VASYTSGMKTAVSIPDDVFENADQLARRLKTSRSALYARALAEFIARHDVDRITDQMNATLEDVGASESEFAVEAGNRRLLESEW